MKRNDITGILTICRKSGKLIAGMDEVKNSCRCGKAVGVIVTCDLSKNSRSEISQVCFAEGVQMYVTTLDMEDIGYALGKMYGVMAVTDPGFMNAMKKNLKKAALDSDSLECE